MVCITCMPDLVAYTNSLCCNCSYWGRESIASYMDLCAQLRYIYKLISTVCNTYSHYIARPYNFNSRPF